MVKYNFIGSTFCLTFKKKQAKSTAKILYNFFSIWVSLIILIRRVISVVLKFFINPWIFLPLFNIISSLFWIILFSTNSLNSSIILFLIRIRWLFRTLILLKNSSRSNIFSCSFTAKDSINWTFNRKSFLFLEMRKDFGSWKGYEK